MVPGFHPRTCRWLCTAPGGRSLQVAQMLNAVMNADAALNDRVRTTYEVVDLDATIASCVGRRMGMAWRGFAVLCSEAFALEFGSVSVFFEVGISIALVLPLTVLCTWVTVTHKYTFGWEIYSFMSFLLAFLLIFRLQTAYARYWEARTVLAEVKTAIISVGLLAVTQYHRHYGDPSDEVKLCVEGVHRYLCLFYFSLVNHLRMGDSGDVRQQNIEHYITEAELDLLRKKRGVLAPVKVVKWIGAQLCHMESMAAWSKVPLGSAPARPLRLLRARLVALGNFYSQGEKSANRAPSQCLGYSSKLPPERRFPRLLTM
jgi:hypothetical protein